MPYCASLFFLQDVHNQLAYKHGKNVYLTFSGAEKFAQESRNENAMKNKEEVLQLIHTGYAALRATTTVDTSKPYVGQGDAVLEKEDIEESQLPSQVVLIRKRQEMELLSVIRVRNEEEIQHIQNLKTARADQLEKQLEVQQKLNFEELIQKDAWQERIRFEHEAELKRKDDLQKCLRVEREESIEYEQRVQQMAIDNEQKRNQMELEMDRAKISLEHDRRMLLDPSYKSAFLETERIAQLPVASVVSIEVVGSVGLEPKSKKPRSAKVQQVEISEAKKQANAAKAAKSAKTRRERAEERAKALEEQKRLEYLAANVTNTSTEAVKARYEDLRIRCGLPRSE